MRSDDLLELLKRQPFQPLQLYLTDGTIFEIDHPDKALVTRSVVKILLPSPSGTEHEAVVSLLHIIRVETVVTLS